ncbi:sn-glycerol-3-phosphate ABC transporter ATP-binding protein UgpC [Reyranella sp.]|uniref:ABC transporter ATP-binding protein n=1 Tax=Reyranella sp. TaxID=1929291 RepID=UPI000BD798A1|nr:sn-glycerol-3-phosphate ABC transporter ATP-binding protein UgpC [Reyranella sp.]OYY34247.1 MAG: sn-glycerol-3-phosphate ABC transporter ATP-binding protein UgpC [Rhodospirillales bacterium 35-66-84]OYZ90908.1 MAG: sn-glycerol-3-phosphate ABC transporter ATP-binding protein UgpC [Rhodospirillales bacterium 24-66-33]OZB21263.1 MAG: sn-glycerol-3-phosphate ABC transporter ATP-binding protein UgpC [Rhodospirillales bacterium 39-66-50]HQS19195.1 sn-glycerol-3-phosphate ABC transporter ATP-bindin
MATVDIRKVEKSYGASQVLHGIDLEIRHGEFAVILGPSGCGKSTLLRMIAGLEEITGGEIAIDGRVVNRLEPRERDIAMVFQNYALYPHMSVAENMSYSLRIAHASKATIRDKVAGVAGILGIGDFLGRKPTQLSGGQRQRVAMGRAIIREPKVFLFDEPLSNLDAKLRHQMRTELKRLHLRLDATSILVTHDQVEAMSLANRLIVMNAGRVEQVGSPGEVYARPATLFVAGFIGSLPMNFFEGSVAPDGRAVVVAGGASIAAGAERIGAPGQEVVVGVRPDALTLAPPQAGGLGGRVELVEDLGSVKLLHLDDGRGGFVVAVPPDTELGEAMQHGVIVRGKDVHVFDARSGRRL